MKFEAAALLGTGEALRLVDVAMGDLRPEDVLVRMVATGICHTDLTVQHGHLPVPLPIVLGHEGSGIVERVGTDVSDLSAGDPVALTFMSCGQCAPCGRGRPAHCRSFGTLNFSGFRADGSTGLTCDSKTMGGHFFGQSSFARFSIANRRNVVKVRADAPLDLIGPFGCGIQTGAGAIFNSLRPEAGESCIVFGGGGVGLSAVMAARVQGCDPIVVVEPQALRRALALELGATLALDPASEADLAARLVEATGGGADAIIDTTGMAAVVGTAIAVLGPQGKLGLVGMHDMQAQASFTILDVIGKGASIQGIVEGDSEPQTFIPYLVDLFLDGQFPVDKLVTFFDFANINDAIAAQAAGEVIKPIVRF